MDTYAIPFSDLIDREPADLTDDERDSLDYYYASVNLAEGLPVDSAPRRWCHMASTVGRISHMLGRIPEAGDPGTTPEILAWISEQQQAPLNGYQRARLLSLPGGDALVSEGAYAGSDDGGVPSAAILIQNSSGIVAFSKSLSSRSRLSLLMPTTVEWIRGSRIENCSAAAAMDTANSSHRLRARTSQRTSSAPIGRTSCRRERQTPSR